MKLHNLKKAYNSEVEKYLKEQLSLTDYQYSRMKSDEIIRFSEYHFYKEDKLPQSNILWRVTILPFLVFVISLYLLLPFTFLFTGKWGYGQKFYDNVYSPWRRKIRIE